MNVLDFLKTAKQDTPFEWKELDQAIQDVEELIIDKDQAQKLFIEQELKHKREIKELKIKFIEDVAFLKKN